MLKSFRGLDKQLCWDDLITNGKIKFCNLNALVFAYAEITYANKQIIEGKKYKAVKTSILFNWKLFKKYKLEYIKIYRRYLYFFWIDTKVFMSLDLFNKLLNKVERKN
jgi:hypothetical protein